MRVRIPDKKRRIVDVTISDLCTKCARFDRTTRRGTPRRTRDGVDVWDNPCGHVDEYADVLRERP